MNDETLSFSEESRLRMPLRFLIALLGVVAAGALAWGFTSRTVADNTRRIETLENDSRSNRELLLRIDERTGEIKRQMDRTR